MDTQLTTTSSVILRFRRSSPSDSHRILYCHRPSVFGRTAHIPRSVAFYGGVNGGSRTESATYS